MRELDHNTLEALTKIELDSKRLTITVNQGSAEMLFHPSAIYKGIERVAAGFLLNGIKKRYERIIALMVDGECQEQDFAVWMNYFSGSSGGIKIDKEYEDHFGYTVDSVMDPGLKKLDDYFLQRRDERNSRIISTYRTNKEIKK
ncbi:MAG TPA: hypothetical protein VJB13_00800 [Candidatus Nanoarchaeia archaeon]|nr:hypothetical protein [Candidatus Nanoarchaeia archaeon]